MILVTGGAGYIGSHMCVALAAAGEPYLILDNFSNSRRSVLQGIAQITGSAPECVAGDVRDADLLDDVLARYPVRAVIHFAALKAVGESVREPLRYYDNNVGGTVTLLQAMAAAGVRTLVFSSSATVYGDPASLPIREDFPLTATNPYGWTKLMMEQTLADLDASEPGQWRIARLRYFNPVGAHESGLIGEDPQGEPNNLMPYVAQVATGERERLRVYGNDYPTPDGTGLRDYIHVCDLVEGHPLLRHGVALADGDGLVVEGVEVDGDAVGRPDLVLAAVAAPDRLGVVEVDVPVLTEAVGELAGER